MAQPLDDSNPAALALTLMKEALRLLDQAGTAVAACHVQHAIELIQIR